MEPAQELSADRRPIDNRHPPNRGARWRVLPTAAMERLNTASHRGEAYPEVRDTSRRTRPCFCSGLAEAFRCGKPETAEARTAQERGRLGGVEEPASAMILGF
jgi:hypothetical protein